MGAVAADCAVVALVINGDIGERAAGVEVGIVAVTLPRAALSRGGKGDLLGLAADVVERIRLVAVGIDGGLNLSTGRIAQVGRFSEVIGNRYRLAKGLVLRVGAVGGVVVGGRVGSFAGGQWNRHGGEAHDLLILKVADTGVAVTDPVRSTRCRIEDAMQNTDSLDGQRVQFMP